MMKNIQVIDGAENCAYDIFQVDDQEFKLIFPLEGQNVAFSSDLGEAALNALSLAWNRPIKKSEAVGIHGTIFFELDFKKEFYPNRRESDLNVSCGRPPSNPN